MDKVHFAKMHGTGNEFVIINEQNRFTDSELGKLSIVMSDRSAGIGSDGLINITVSNYSCTFLATKVFDQPTEAIQLYKMLI